MKSRRVLLLFLLAALAPQVGAQNASSSPPLSPPGRLIDLGGWRLHINCTGRAMQSGQPTVVLEAGAGDFSVDWSLVQPELARFARVCSYDRAGSAWSDLGPRPRTMKQIVSELHWLLDKAGEHGPFVLVGHSFGGTLVRVYADAFPRDVAAVVLVEAGDINGVWTLRGGQPVRLVETATGTPVPAARTSGPLSINQIPPVALGQIEAAAREGGATANEPPRDKLPPDAQRMRAWATAQPKMYASNDNPFEAEELAILRDEALRTSPPLGDIPLAVLSRGRPDRDTSAEAGHTAAQAALVTLSRNSSHTIAVKSGHHIPIEQPELVVSAVREVIGKAAKN